MKGNSIHAARVEGIGTVYGTLELAPEGPRLLVRREPHEASKVVAYVGSSARGRRGLGQR